MKFVEIYKLQNNGEQRIIAVCRLADQGIICDGDKIFVKNLMKNGVRNYADPKIKTALFPKDGLRFLENLKHAFKSAYLAATDIKEE